MGEANKLSDQKTLMADKMVKRGTPCYLAATINGFLKLPLILFCVLFEAQFKGHFDRVGYTCVCVCLCIGPLKEI